MWRVPVEECPVCGASIDGLIDSLQDSLSPDNRALAHFIIENCSSCKSIVREVIKKEASKLVSQPDLDAPVLYHIG